MSVETLKLLSLAAFILAGALLVLTIGLFIGLNIPLIIGDLSGRNAKKAIENIRRQNEENKDAARKPSLINMERGKVTDRISATGTLFRNDVSFDGSVGTEKFNTTRLAEMARETSLLGAQAEETSLLQEQGNETTLLSPEHLAPAAPKPAVFALELEIGYIGSSEIIE